jgi:hypothetical protein
VALAERYDRLGPGADAVALPATYLETVACKR